MGRGGIRKGRGIDYGIYKENNYAVIIADVSVDLSGHVRMSWLWCVRDRGLEINLDQMHAQCEGTFVWSIGMVLSDDLPSTGAGKSAIAAGSGAIANAIRATTDVRLARFSVRAEECAA